MSDWHSADDFVTVYDTSTAEKFIRCPSCSMESPPRCADQRCWWSARDARPAWVSKTSQGKDRMR